MLGSLMDQTDASYVSNLIAVATITVNFSLQPTLRAFDIIKFLRTEVSTEAGFRYNIVAESHLSFSLQE